MKFHRSPSKATDEWGTPQWLYDLLHREFRFQLDVCASEKNYKHDRFLTKLNDAFATTWMSRNFCNPPYSNILPWYRKAIEERDERGNLTCFVTKCDPSTRHGVIAAQEMDEIRIIEHRIAYEGAPNSANFPSAVMVCRPRLYTRKTGARVLYVDYREAME